MKAWSRVVGRGRGRGAGAGPADVFLAAQGDVWHTWLDMFCALIGTTLSVTPLSRVHDRQPAFLPTGSPASDLRLAAVGRS